MSLHRSALVSGKKQLDSVYHTTTTTTTTTNTTNTMSTHFNHGRLVLRSPPRLSASPTSPWPDIFTRQSCALACQSLATRATARPQAKHMTRRLAFRERERGATGSCWQMVAEWVPEGETKVALRRCFLSLLMWLFYVVLLAVFCWCGCFTLCFWQCFVDVVVSRCAPGFIGWF